MIFGPENTERPKLHNLIRETPLLARHDTVTAIIESLPTDELRNTFDQGLKRVFKLLVVFLLL